MKKAIRDTALHTLARDGWMVFLAFALWLALASLASSAWSDGRVEVAVPASHIIAEDDIAYVTLGALAESIETDDETFKAALLDLPIIDAPQPGDSSRFNSINILQAARRANLDYRRISLIGSRQTEVFGPGQTVDMDRMIDAIQADILRESGWSLDELSMRVLSSPPEQVWLPPGDVKLYINRVTPHFQGNARFEVEFYIDRVQVDKAIFLVSSERRRTVMVPVDDMKRGDVIGPDDLQERIIYVDNEALDKQIAGDLDDLVGSRVKTSLRKNEPIKWFALESNYVLRHGSVVTMIIRHNGLTMHAQAEAQKRAAPGDVIPVKAEATGQVVMARVLDRDLVELIN